MMLSSSLLFHAPPFFEILTFADIAESNLAKFRQKPTNELDVTLLKGDARELNAFADKSFDMVLVLGPLYHMESREDALRCVREALRVMKPDGFAYFAFISNDMVILTEWNYCCEKREHLGRSSHLLYVGQKARP